MHRLVGHLASANSNNRSDSNGRSDSSVGNTSNKTMASNTSNETVANNTSNETMAGNTSNETGSSNKASHCTVASEELGSGGGSCHKGGDTEGGLGGDLNFENIREAVLPSCC